MIHRIGFIVCGLYFLGAFWLTGYVMHTWALEGYQHPHTGLFLGAGFLLMAPAISSIADALQDSTDSYMKRRYCKGNDNG